MKYFKFPWKRNMLIAELLELSDINFQKNKWGKEPVGYVGGAAGVFDCIIEDESLDENARSWVGYYLFEDEINVIEDFAKDLKEVYLSVNEYDNKEVWSHKLWPNVTDKAKVALNRLLDNDKKYHIEYNPAEWNK